MICAGEQRTALYRFYDADEKLLYVGITNDPWRRWRQHVQEKPWYPQVKHQAVTWYDTRIAAEIAEHVAIRREHPRFNIAGAVRPVEVPVEEPASARPVTADPEPVPGPAPEPDPEPDPEPELQRAAEPAPLPGPAAGSAPPRRTLIAVLTCAAWAFLPSMPGMPNWRNPWMIALAASTVIPVMAVALIAAAPRIHRFGRWLEHTFMPDGVVQ
jgi:predicted GIY-YIG superfamily endonuclease